MVTIAETSRIPVDNQETHLELTMIHEAMVLEYSGRSLALIELASHIKQIVFFTILANVVFPIGAGLAVYVIKILMISAMIGVIEISVAKMRLFRAVDFLTFSLVLSMAAFFLVLTALYIAMLNNNVEIYIVAGLLFAIKVVAIPYILSRIVRRIKVEEGAGLFINPTLSVFIAVLLTYLSYLFTGHVMPGAGRSQSAAVIISLSVTLIGLFLMMSRMKAVSQIIGLLVMENGLFLIAIFFDIFVCVVILGMFVYRINKLFTHINVSKLQELKG
jgi:hydrogenase-4 membrane subunit HyfE